MIIGLTGYAQSGKDTVGKILVEEHGFERIAFADALRDCLYALNPFVPSRIDGYIDGYSTLQSFVDCYGWDDAKQDPEIRRMLQVLGTEVGRDIIDPDVWVKVARRKLDSPGDYVFTDVRFPNEVRLIEDFFGELWRIERDGVGPVNDHASEQLDATPNAVLRNNGTIESLSDIVSLTVSGYSK